MSWLSNLLFGKDAGPSATQSAFTAATKRRGATAQAAEDRYLANDAAFDPRTALKEYSAGAMSDFQRSIATELEKLKGGSVASGRLDTGFFDQDQGDVVSDLGARYQADINRHALETAGMRQRQIEGQGAFAQNATTDYQDMLAGELDRETAKDNAKRQQRGGLLSAAGTVIGGIAGGPIGAAVGKKIAGAV